MAITRAGMTAIPTAAEDLATLDAIFARLSDRPHNRAIFATRLDYIDGNAALRANAALWEKRYDEHTLLAAKALHDLKLARAVITCLEYPP